MSTDYDETYLRINKRNHRDDSYSDTIPPNSVAMVNQSTIDYFNSTKGTRYRTPTDYYNDIFGGVGKVIPSSNPEQDKSMYYAPASGDINKLVKQALSYDQPAGILEGGADNGWMLPIMVASAGIANEGGLFSGWGGTQAPAPVSDAVLSGAGGTSSGFSGAAGGLTDVQQWAQGMGALSPDGSINWAAVNASPNVVSMGAIDSGAVVPGWDNWISGYASPFTSNPNAITPGQYPGVGPTGSPGVGIGPNGAITGLSPALSALAKTKGFDLGKLFETGLNYGINQDLANKYLDFAREAADKANPLNSPQRKQYQDQLSAFMANPNAFYENDPGLKGQLANADQVSGSAERAAQIADPMQQKPRLQYQQQLSDLLANPSKFYETNPVVKAQLDLARQQFEANTAKMGTGGTQFTDYLRNVQNAAAGTFNDQAQLLSTLGAFNQGTGSAGTNYASLIAAGGGLKSDAFTNAGKTFTDRANTLGTLSGFNQGTGGAGNTFASGANNSVAQQGESFRGFGQNFNDIFKTLFGGAQ